MQVMYAYKEKNRTIIITSYTKVFMGNWSLGQFPFLTVFNCCNHVHLVEALEAGDLKRAKAILREDVEAFKNEIL